MIGIVKHISDIPENIYIQIPSLIYKTWEKQFVEMSKYAERIADKSIKISEKGYIKSSARFYVEKSQQDPFDLTYVIFFRAKAEKFISSLNAIIQENSIDFNYNTFYDKKKLLDYINTEISRMFGRKFYIEIDIPYVKMCLETTEKTMSYELEF